MPKGETLEKRFWDKVDKKGPDECWEWQGCRNRKGYGAIRFGEVMQGSHRVSFFLTHGHWPEPCCCHSCDNPGCVNPHHLWEGTNTENVIDRDQKGRATIRKGELHTQAKLTEYKVREIRERYALGGIFQTELGKKYGVTGATICNIVNKKNWRGAS